MKFDILAALDKLDKIAAGQTTIEVGWVINVLRIKLREETNTGCKTVSMEITETELEDSKCNILNMKFKELLQQLENSK